MQVSRNERRLQILLNHLQYHPSSHLLSTVHSANCSKEDDVFVEDYENGARIITLNRPKHLNALTTVMIIKLKKFIKEIREDSAADFIVLRGVGTKAFCAGGDIRELATAAKENTPQVIVNYFAPLFRYVLSVYRYKKPYISILDGITMGGGVGVSIGSLYRVASERLQFAMPETAIGFVTDIGAGHFLARLGGPKGLGLCMALTSLRLGPGDALMCGVATHYVPSSNIPSLLEAFKKAPKGMNAQSLHLLINSFSAPAPESKLLKLFPLIEYCYGAAESVEDVIERLDQIQTGRHKVSGVDEEVAKDWSKNSLSTIFTKCPVSLMVVFRLMTLKPTPTIEESLIIEYRIVLRMIMRTWNFYEGVRAVILDKDNKPDWRPKKVEEVDDVLVVDYFFADFDEEEEENLSKELSMEFLDT